MAFTGFINEFANSPIQPTFQSYLALDFTGITKVLLEWPYVNLNSPTPYAQTIQVTVNTSSTNAIYMPDATMATQGQTNTIINSSASTILVYSFTGVLIATILNTQSWLITLTNNTNSAGAWLPLQLASTTSSFIAASLIDTSTDSNGHANAGGLAAFPTNFLKENVLVNKVSTGSTYTQAEGDRGSLLVWNSGSGTYTCLPSATFGNGYTFAILNNSNSGGQLTVVPAAGDTIDGDSVPFVLNPGSSSCFCADGVNTIYSYSASQSQTNVVTLTSVDLNTAVSNILELSQTQASFSIQKYVNNPSSSVITVIYPKNIFGEWVAYNASTTNPIAVTLYDGTLSYSIPPGQRLFLFSDGTNLYNVPNFIENADIYLADGSAAAPSLSFTNDLTTGLFRQTSGTYANALGVTQDGTATMYFDNTQNTSLVDLSIPAGTISTPGLFFATSVTSGISLTTSGAYTGAVTLGQNGAATFYALNTLNTSVVPLALPNGATATPALLFTSAPTSGVYLTTSGAYVNAVTIGQGSADTFYFQSAGNTNVGTLNTVGGSYDDQGTSIYSLMRAYG